MKQFSYDVLVIGAGAAGMAAALELDASGLSVALIEREDRLGGILFQCIHNGFGLHEFKEELTGPEYATRFIDSLSRSRVTVYLGTTLVDVENPGDEEKAAVCYSAAHGVLRLTARAIVLAMGCRERNRGNIGVPGTRPSGIFTAGLAQRLVNIDGYIPGSDVVVVGSGDIGLIMARRMTWAGSRVHGVVEILPYPSGITRNIVQCLRDFDIPLHLSHQVSRVRGKDRIEGVEVTPLVDGAPDQSRSFDIPCDTLLLSVGLIPENDISKKIGVVLSPQTGGAVVDAWMMTTVPGIFAAGNVLHVHDLVDYVSEESRRAGAFVVEYLAGRRPQRQLRVKAGSNVKYVNPGKLDPDDGGKFYLRPLIVKNGAAIEVRLDGQVIKRSRKSHIQPSEMLTVHVDQADAADKRIEPDSIVEVSVV